MHFNLRHFTVILVSCILITLFFLPRRLLAQQHVVNPSDIHKELVSATETRKQNRDKLNQLFSSKAAQKALKSAQLNPERVKTAVATLSDAELAQLASSADKLRDDFAAGRLSDRDLLIILVGIAVIILVIVAVN
jgi:hypothetical protein